MDSLRERATKFSSETAQIARWTNDSLRLHFTCIAVDGVRSRAVEIIRPCLADRRHCCNLVSATTTPATHSERYWKPSFGPGPTSFERARVFGSRSRFRRPKSYQDHRCCTTENIAITSLRVRLGKSNAYAWDATRQTHYRSLCLYHRLPWTNSARCYGRAKLSGLPMTCTSHLQPKCSLIQSLQKLEQHDRATLTSSTVPGPLQLLILSRRPQRRNDHPLSSLI